MARTAILPVPQSVAKGPTGALKNQSLDEARGAWIAVFRRVRGETETRAAHLSAEDQIVQSM